MLEIIPPSVAPKARTDSLERLLNEACQSEHAQIKQWRVELDAVGQWFHCSTTSAIVPEQGWKLHISANASSAETVLRCVLPLLLAGSSNFKVVASLQKLAKLNQGEGGASQIGKFITIYPKDDSEAVQLASKLDEATRELSGPAVPSDRPLYPGSRVHYRYGGIANRLFMQTPVGRIEPAIRTPKNELIPDHRHPRYEAPAWVIDPFLKAGIAQKLPEPSRLIGERYLILASMFLSVNHIIYLAVDLEEGRSCVIKGPGYASLNNPSYTIARTSIEHEAEILTRLAPNPHFPAIYALVEQENNLFLVMEDLEGETLDKHISSVTNQSQHIPFEQVIAWGRELAELFETIHEKGLVYGDIKPTNVILDENGQLHLIDFDLAHEIGDENQLWRGRGTPGYMSPQVRNDQPITISDDIYGLGALLYFMLTNADPSSFPQQHALLDRSIELMRPGIGKSLKKVVARCLHSDPCERYASMSELKESLIAITRDEVVAAISYEDEIPDDDTMQAKARYYILAGRLLDTLCAEARRENDNQGLFWTSTHPLTYGLAPRDINTGNAGTLLALTELVAEFAESHAQAVLAEGAQWLSTTPAIGNSLLPGFYVGTAGIGAALLRAGQVLNDEKLIVAAVERGRQIVSLPHTSPDLYNGTAGRLLFHLLLWDETEEREHLNAAVACGEQLLTRAILRDNREVCWSMPEGYTAASNRIMLGYAHGVAGIADVLLDLFEVTADERFLALVQGVGRLLIQQAVPALVDKSGLNWPTFEGEAPTSAFWCRGAGGIARFFLHAARCTVIPEARDIAARAARTVACSTRWADVTQCHGLSGNIELLLDMYQATGNRSYLIEAFTFGRLLETFACEQDGRLLFPSDIPNTFTPDYMVGYGGIATCLLRLSAPERLPHLLSRAGFRSCKPGVENMRNAVNVPAQKKEAFNGSATLT